MAKRGRAAVEAGEVGPIARKGPRTAAGCRMYMRGELTKGFAEIVGGFVEAAKTGSLPHVKLVTEILELQRPMKLKRPAAVTALLKRMAE